MRAIDADAFKEYIRGACEDMKHLFKDNADFAKLITESFCKDIDEQPTIQPEPHWIPVDLENNEPPLEDWVLVSSDGYVMQDCIVERGGKKIWYHGGNIQADDRYMPLPEPYKSTVPPECEGDCGWCKPSVIEKCKGVTT